MSHRVLLGCPGKPLSFGCARGLFRASLAGHEVDVLHAGGSWDNFGVLWAAALNAGQRGEATHFAMLHTDIGPEDGWLDVLLAEMERLQADLVSVAVPIRNTSGVCSCGIGDPADRWSPLRRFTLREIDEFPQTFDAADAGYPGGILLHNSGCWVCDLRQPLFYRTRGEGTARAFLDFRHRVFRDAEGKWQVAGESEDWTFSRQLHELGARTLITRKVRLSHFGSVPFPNHGEWGQEHDEATRVKWGKESIVES